MALEIDDRPVVDQHAEQEPERDAARKRHIHYERDGLGLAVADDVERLRHEGSRGQDRCDR